MIASSPAKDGRKRGLFKLVGALAAVAALQGCVIFVGPSDDDEVIRDLVQARALWNVNGVTDYDVIARTLCFCGFGGQDVRVEVRDGVVISVVHLATGQELPAGAHGAYRTVEALFDLIEHAVESDAHQINARFDGFYGYPEFFFIDYSENTADEEFGYEISAFIRR